MFIQTCNARGGEPALTYGHMEKVEYEIKVCLFPLFAGGSEGLQNDGLAFKSHRQERSLLTLGRKRAVRHFRRHVPSHRSAH